MQHAVRWLHRRCRQEGNLIQQWEARNANFGPFRLQATQKKEFSSLPLTGTGERKDFEIVQKKAFTRRKKAEMPESPKREAMPTLVSAFYYLPVPSGSVRVCRPADFGHQEGGIKAHSAAKGQGKLGDTFQDRTWRPGALRRRCPVAKHVVLTNWSQPNGLTDRQPAEGMRKLRRHGSK